jgi:uncharacterized membrane protein
MGVVATFLATLIALAQTASPLPQSQSLSRDEARRSGCYFVAIEGQGVDTCVIRAFREGQVSLTVYESH